MRIYGRIFAAEKADMGKSKMRGRHIFHASCKAWRMRKRHNPVCT